MKTAPDFVNHEVLFLAIYRYFSLERLVGIEPTHSASETMCLLVNFYLYMVISAVTLTTLTNYLPTIFKLPTMEKKWIFTICHYVTINNLYVCTVVFIENPLGTRTNLLLLSQITNNTFCWFKPYLMKPTNRNKWVQPKLIAPIFNYIK